MSDDIASVRCILPSVVIEQGLAQFHSLLVSCDHAGEAILDCSEATDHCPAAIASTGAIIRRWLDRGTRVSIEGAVSHGGYRAFHISPQDMKLHSMPPLYELSQSGGQVDRVSSELAQALVSEGWTPDGAFPFVQYCLGELLTNCRQHAGSSAFAYGDRIKDERGEEAIRIAVADCGIGIRESFVSNESPHAHPNCDDQAAIRIALGSQVSSTRRRSSHYNQSANFGLGLSMVRTFARMARGEFCIFSGNARVSEGSDNVLEQACFWPGTVVSVLLPLETLGDYRQRLAEALRVNGLTSGNDTDNLFA